MDWFAIGGESLLLWLVVSAPAMCLIWLFIQPTYEAFSLLRVEPSTLNLFAPSNNQDNTTTHLPYLQTQVQLIKSDRVLEMALANTDVATLPSIKQSSDPKYDLNKDLTVEQVQDAYLIRVALESKIPSEAAIIVNAVVNAYKKHTEAYAQSANRRLRESLETEERILLKKIDMTQNELKVLVQNGNVAVPAAKEKEPVLNKNDDPAQPQPTFKNLGESHLPEDDGGNDEYRIGPDRSRVAACWSWNRSLRQAMGKTGNKSRRRMRSLPRSSKRSSRRIPKWLV